MLPFQQAFRVGFTAATLAAVAACSADVAGHAGEEEHHHVHEPKLGGTLVELGNHFANMELVCDEETGDVAMYTWDAHVTTSQRSSTEAVTLTVAPHSHGEGDAVEAFTVVLEPVVTKTNGQTVGDASQFTGQHDSMKGLDHATITVAEITLKGQTFTDVEFLYPADAHDHDHDGEDG